MVSPKNPTLETKAFLYDVINNDIIIISSAQVLSWAEFKVVI